MGWQDVTRRAFVGEKHELKAVEGALWIRPKKWGSLTLDRMRELGQHLAKNKEQRKGLVKYEKLREKYGDKISDGTLKVTDLPEDEQDVMFDIAALLEDQRNADILRIGIADGIGEHNFENGNGKLVNNGKTFDKKTVDEILEWGDLASEIFQAIQDYNRPLAEKRSSDSGTPSTGSTTDNTSTK